MSIFGRKKEEAKLPTVSIFGGKKEEVKLPTVEELRLKMDVEPPRPIELPKPTEPLFKETERPKQMPKEIKENEEQQSFAPLFIKLDRYKQILNSLTELKTTLAMIKNSFSVLSELEKLKEENLKLIESTMEKVETELTALDSEFLRPSGYQEGIREEAHELGGLDTGLTSLKDRVNQLKIQLERLS